MFPRSYALNMQPLPVLKRPNARRIGLIADTHIPGRQRELNPQIAIIFADVHLILHAGDIAAPHVIDQLGQTAETMAVRGNNRGDRMAFDPPLPRFRVIEAADRIRIGLTHGMVTQWQRLGDNIIGRAGFANKGSMRLVRRVSPYFNNVDCIVFGHGHWPFLHYGAGTLYLNPGRAFGPTESSCAVMDLHPTRITIRYHLLGSPGRIRSLADKPHTFPLAQK